MTDAAEERHDGESDDRILDRLRIQDLVLAYAEAVDAQDAAAVAELFTADAVFRAYDRPKGEARGRPEVEVLIGKLVGSFRATLHHVSGPRIEFDSPTHAAGSVALHAWHSFRDDRPDGLLWGRYHDRYVRSPEGWRFAARTLVVAGNRDFDFPWITTD
ncbi:MAG: nuclear transport factor 2 family protein [Microbacterium sp.]